MPIGFSTGSFTRLGPGLYSVGFDVGFDAARYATGMEKCCFEFFYVLYTRKRSIPRNPSTGTGFRDLIGTMAVGSAIIAQVELAVMHEIMDAEGQVMDNQNGVVALPDTERLASVAVTHITVDVAHQRVLVSLRITNAAGKTVGFELPVGTP